MEMHQKNITSLVELPLYLIRCSMAVSFNRSYCDRIGSVINHRLFDAALDRHEFQPSSSAEPPVTNKEGEKCVGFAFEKVLDVMHER